MEESKFDVERHIKYWQRCLKSLLPTEYTNTDSSRVMLGFFILAALDLLGAGAETLPPPDVKAFKSWILGCQHPNGGFCGSPNHKYPDSYYDESGRGEIESANLPATFFAILSLSFVGNLSDVRRAKCLRWLKSLQREDGSFGEGLGKDGKVMGGSDMRYCHFASGVRWMLRGDLAPVRGETYEDIDVEKLMRHIRSSETYDGGIGESFQHESHAGYTYCAIASLSFLDRLPRSPSNTAPFSTSTPEISNTRERGLTNIPGTIRWLLSRQLAYHEADEEEDGHGPDPHDFQQEISDRSHSYTDLPSLADLTLNEPRFVGFNGRVNKLADTCYCFWVSASLEVNWPNHLYHSYLGLATLAMMKEPGLKQVDPTLCVSVQTKEKIEKAIITSWIPTKTYWKHGHQFESFEAAPNHAQIMVDNEGPPQWLTDAVKKMNDQHGLNETNSPPAERSAA